MALLHLSNGAASVPSSILGAFSRPVPPSSTDTDGKTSAPGPLMPPLAQRLAKEGNIHTEQQLLLQQPDGYLGAHKELGDFPARHPIVQGFLDFTGSFQHPTGILSQGRIAA